MLKEKINCCSKIACERLGSHFHKKLHIIGQDFAHCVANRFAPSLTCHAACVSHPPIGVRFLDVYSQENVQESRIGSCLMRLFSYVRHVRLLDFTKIYT